MFFSIGPQDHCCSQVANEDGAFTEECQSHHSSCASTFPRVAVLSMPPHSAPCPLRQSDELAHPPSGLWQFRPVCPPRPPCPSAGDCPSRLKDICLSLIPLCHAKPVFTVVSTVFEGGPVLRSQVKDLETWSVTEIQTLLDQNQSGFSPKMPGFCSIEEIYPQ